MNSSKASKVFQSQSAEAYHNFENRGIPFVAVKLFILGFEFGSGKVDDIVRKNFRSENDFLLSSKTKYAILMPNTTLEAAEEATNRLGVKLRLLIDSRRNLDRVHRLILYAYIYGVSQASRKLQFRYLDVFNTIHHKKKARKWPTNFKEYLKWLEPSVIKEHRPINIVV